MTKSLNCPMCAAPLDFRGVQSPTMRCPYCGNQVILPEELREKQGMGGIGEKMAKLFAPALDQALKMSEVSRLVRAGNKIEAIKVYREAFGGSLKDAKDAVDRMEAAQSHAVTHATIQMGDAEAHEIQISGHALGRPIHQKSVKKIIWLVVILTLLPIIIVMVALVGGGLAAFFGFRQAQQASNNPMRESTPFPRSTTTASPTPSPTPSFATVAFEFGSEGIGAGQFKDARSVTVDGQGRIYVGEYTGGRVQVFDSEGKFITQWMLDPKVALLALSADRSGNVYVLQPGHIFRYEGATGRLLGEVMVQQDSLRYQSYSDLIVALDGSLYAASTHYNIVQLSPGGEIKKVIDVKERAGDDVILEKIAVDGSGYVYALDRRQQSVLKFGPDGRFINRFGSRGDGAGQFISVNGIAVDGQGRIYVSDSGRPIQVFDNSGRYLDSFGERGVVFDLVINDRNEIFAADRNRYKVVKYVLSKHEEK